MTMDTQPTIEGLEEILHGADPHLTVIESAIFWVREMQPYVCDAYEIANHEHRKEKFRASVDAEKDKIRQKEQGFWRRLWKTRLVIKLEQRP